MKRGKWIYYLAVTVLLIGITVVFIFRFVLDQDDSQSFKIENIEKIWLTDTNGNRLSLKSRLAINNSCYCLLFELNNCYSCIYKGLEDLNSLRASDLDCLAIVIHDNLDDVRGWSEKQIFSSFYVMKKIDFYQHIHSPLLPVFIEIKNGEVNKYRFITP